ncbi:MAG: nuclear transport factor 2 family protein [Pseudomonadales bacterium]
MTDEEARNLAAVDHWEATYNDDVERMVDECYAPDCEVHNMLAGPEAVYRGREALREIERQIQRAQIDRRMLVVSKFASGNRVAVEAEGVFGEHRFPACVILTFDDAGLIRTDHTYSPDPTGLTR